MGGRGKKKIYISKARPIKLVRYVNLSLQAVAHYDGLMVAYTIFSIRLVHCWLQPNRYHELSLLLFHSFFFFPGWRLLISSISGYRKALDLHSFHASTIFLLDCFSPHIVGS